MKRKKRTYNGNKIIISLRLIFECCNKFWKMGVHFLDAIEVFDINLFKPGNKLVRCIKSLLEVHTAHHWAMLHTWQHSCPRKVRWNVESIVQHAERTPRHQTFLTRSG